jgi:hypothetical protein
LTAAVRGQAANRPSRKNAAACLAASAENNMREYLIGKTI